MTATAFIATDAQENITPILMNTYRRINKYIEANPDWWHLEILDGFGAYFGSHYAIQEHQKYKIISLKEEGNSSHVNQVYDRFVAKNNKKLAAS